MPLYAERYCPSVASELTPRIRFPLTLVPPPCGATFGHAANSQFGPVRLTYEPSGHILASCGHTCACPPEFCPDHQYHPPARRIRRMTTQSIVADFIKRIASR